MDTCKGNMFNIEERNKILEEKCKSKDYILFETKIPSTDFLGEIEIQVGYNPSPMFIALNYFLSYGILHEFLQIFNSTERETFDYFCKEILDKKELNINETKKILTKRERLKADNVLGFDFSKEGFFEQEKKFSKGSDITNFSFCYRNNLSVSVLEVFLLKNIKREEIIIIKIPNIISLVANEYIKILSYIFEDVRLVKLTQDSFFKDSCHIILTKPDINRYNVIKDNIKNSLKEKNIKKTETLSLCRILKPNVSCKQKEIDFKINEFSFLLQILIATYLLNIIKVLKTSLENNYRNPEEWQYLDFYLSKCL